MNAAKILLDTNILADWIGRRSPFEADAKKIIHACIFGQIEGYVTSHSLTDLFYILRKDIPENDRIQFISLICQSFIVLVEDADCFLETIAHSEWPDLEDGLQMQCAESAQLDYIVTRNTKDFINSHTKVVCEDDFSKMLNQEQLYVRYNC
jgi:predicted nucleic acid-binding protein